MRGTARLRRRCRQLRRAGGRASREVRRRGHAARPRRLAREEHVRVPDRRAATSCRTSRSGWASSWSTARATNSCRRSSSATASTGAVERIPPPALFVMIGAEPRTEWLDGTVERDERGFILTGDDRGPPTSSDWPLERAPMLLETSLPGVFAAGDVRHGSVKRVTTAMGEGATVDPARAPATSRVTGHRPPRAPAHS